MEDHFLIEVKLRRDEIDSFENYSFCLNGVKSLASLRMHPAVTFFIGENGSGKSTLLEAIAVSLGFNPEGGTKNFRFGTRESHSRLWRYIRLSPALKDQEMATFCGQKTFLMLPPK